MHRVSRSANTLFLHYFFFVIFNYEYVSKKCNRIKMFNNCFFEFLHSRSWGFTLYWCILICQRWDKRGKDKKLSKRQKFPYRKRGRGKRRGVGDGKGYVCKNCERLIFALLTDIVLSGIAIAIDRYVVEISRP